jgi:hypothetical protein
LTVPLETAHEWLSPAETDEANREPAPELEPGSREMSPQPVSPAAMTAKNEKIVEIFLCF